MTTEDKLAEINETIGNLAIELMDQIKKTVERNESDGEFELQEISNLGILFTGEGKTGEGKEAILAKRVFLHDAIDRVLGVIELHRHDVLLP